MGGRTRINKSWGVAGLFCLYGPGAKVRNLIGNGGWYQRRLLFVIEAVKIGNMWNVAKGGIRL